jgi:hypothetical protein
MLSSTMCEIADETVLYLLLCVLSNEAEIIYCHVLRVIFQKTEEFCEIEKRHHA